MKLVLLGTHVDQTIGYAKITHNILQHISLIPNLKVYHFGFQRHENKPNIRVAPKNVSVYDVTQFVDVKTDSFGMTKFPQYLKLIKPDVILMYNDAMMCSIFLDAIRSTDYKGKVWVYLDQLYVGIHPHLVEKLNTVDKIYCFTEEWKSIWKSYSPKHPSLEVLEHSVDKDIFGHVDTKLETRKKYNLPEDAVVIMNCNRNSVRKRHDIGIMGFVQYLKATQRKDVFFLIITGMNSQTMAHYDLRRIYEMECQFHKLDESFIDQLRIVDTSPPNRLSDADMNDLYHTCDIGINTSDGEGFGLCPYEHLYTGAPQILTDIGVYKSFIPDNVVEYVPAIDRAWCGGTMVIGAFTPVFHSTDVAKAINQMILTLPEKKENVKKMTFKTWDCVLQPLLEDIRALV